MTKFTLSNGQFMTFASDHSGNDSLAFVGNASAAGQVPTATFTGSNTLSSITDTGSTTAPGQGLISLMAGSSLTTNGLSVSSATLWITEKSGSSMTFGGTSQITAGTVTVSGYAGTGSYTVNGTMNIGASSTVNMDYVKVHGSGTFHLTAANALLRLGTVDAGDTVVLDSGMLSLTNGISFAGTITDSTPGTSRIGANASVDVYNAMDAVRETFNRTTGVLDLFNAAGGTPVASLKFAGTGDLYAAPTTGLATNYIAITSNAAGSLPVTFTS